MHLCFCPVEEDHDSEEFFPFNRSRQWDSRRKGIRSSVAEDRKNKNLVGGILNLKNGCSFTREDVVILDEGRSIFHNKVPDHEELLRRFCTKTVPTHL